MKETLWTAFELLVNLLEAFIGMQFVCVFLGEDIKSRKGLVKWVLLSFLFASVTTILNSLVIYEGAFLFIYVCVIFVYALIFLPGSVPKKFFVSIFEMGCMISISNLWTNLVTTILGTDMKDLLSKPSLIRFITIALVQMSYVLIFHFLLQIFRKSVIHLRKLEWCMLFAVFLFSSAIIVMVQLTVIRESLSQNTRLMLLGADAAAVLINLVTLELLLELSRHFQEKLETQHLHAQLQYQTQYAIAIQQQEETVHKLRHNMKQSFSVLKELADQDNTEQIRAYLEQYNEELHAMLSFVKTNLVCVDAIINTKLTYAQENGIAVFCRIDQNLPALREIDYCTLLGNMLDNAIEASLKLSLQPEILLEIQSTNTQLRVIVKNRISKSVLSQNPTLKSTKQDSLNHGYGIQTIKEISKKYDGDADFYEETEWFVTSVRLSVTKVNAISAS